MKYFRMIALIALVVGLLGITPFAQAQIQQTDVKIQTVMSAAPMAVAEDATKMDYPTGAGGLKVELPFSEMGMKGSGALMTATEPITQTEAKIQSAMSAAPIAIARDATILDYPANPTDPPIELRKGTNGWSCFPTAQLRLATIPYALTRLL